MPANRQHLVTDLLQYGLACFLPTAFLAAAQGDTLILVNDGAGIHVPPTATISSLHDARSHEIGQAITFEDGTVANLSYKVDDDGRRLTKTDAVGRETRYSYDEKHQIIEVRQPTIDPATGDPIPGITRISYGPDGSITEIVHDGVRINLSKRSAHWSGYALELGEPRPVL